MPEVVIVRKDKRIRHKLLHGIAFALTGGASGVVTAAEAANHASYNRRTRKLAAKGKVKFSPEEIEYLKAHTAGKHDAAS